MLSSKYEQTPNLILLDSSTDSCSISLYKGRVCLYSHVERAAFGKHIVFLPQMLDYAINLANSLGLILNCCVISSGPGSYTGLRIASSLAKGVCYGLGIPLIAISTLELLVGGYRKQVSYSHLEKVYLLPIMEAKGGEVFLGVFDAQGKRLFEDMQMSLSRDSLLRLLPDHDGAAIHLIGSVAKDYKYLSEEMDLLHINDSILIEAEHMSDIALKKWELEDFVSIAYFTPNYLKEYLVTARKNKILSHLE